MYHPSDGAGAHPAVELVARSAPVSENELVLLLRRRLRFLLIILAVLYTLVFLVNLFYVLLAALPRETVFWANLATSVLCIGLAAILTTRPGLTLRQLRGFDLLLVVVFVFRLLLVGYRLFASADYLDRVHDWIAAGKGENARQMLSGLVYRLMSGSAMWVVAYGVIVPNTWRRCALVVAMFTFAPMVIWLVACAAGGLPLPYWFPIAAPMAFLVSIQIAILSVYGAYRIESSRLEAAQARRLGQYYVMEYLPGLTLEQLVERHGPLPPARAVHFLRQICGALREAHASGSSTATSSRATS